MPLGYGCQGVIILANSSFNALHLPLSALGLSIVRLFVVYIPFAFIGSQLFDLQGIFVAAVLANVIVASVAFIWFTRVIKNKILQVRVE